MKVAMVKALGTEEPLKVFEYRTDERRMMTVKVDSFVQLSPLLEDCLKKEENDNPKVLQHARFLVLCSSILPPASHFETQ
jgi:hypothetical protein